MPIAPMVDVTANQKCHEGNADFCNHIDILRLANWGLGKMAEVLQTTLDNATSWMKKIEIWLNMMTSSNGNIFRVTGPLCGEFTGSGELPTQRPVTRSFDVFFDLRLNKRLSKQP